MGLQQKKVRFNRICNDIKSLKIQGAKNVAKAGLLAYTLIPTLSSKKKILSLRPTEAMLINILNKQNPHKYNEFLKTLKENQDKINLHLFKLIKNNSLIFTHCHSSSVTEALIYAKKKGKKFEVYNTETRPLYQGRKTAQELSKAKIKVTMFVDSAATIALTKKQKTKKANLVLLGADAISKNGTLNKVGSGMFAQIAKINKIPLYIISDSLKYLSKETEIEQRNPKEIWNIKNNKNLKIKNPAFELIDKKFIKGVISEFGILSYEKFIKKMN
jgi:ribose 1,5-bisphosphate isomerase